MPLTHEEVRQIVREEMQEFFASDRYIFHKTLQLLDGRNVILGKGTGTKFGTEATQKASFYGVTPVVQASAIGAPVTQSGVYVSGDVESITSAVNSIRVALKAFGIIA